MELLHRLLKGVHWATATIDVYGYDIWDGKDIYLDVHYEKHIDDLPLERLKMYLVPLTIERLLYRVEKDTLTFVVGFLLDWMSTCETHGFRELRQEKPDDATLWATVRVEYRYRKRPYVLLYPDLHSTIPTPTRPTTLMAMVTLAFAADQIPMLGQSEREVAVKMLREAAPYWPENPPRARWESWDWDVRGKN